MATRQQLEDALIQADQAGDKQAADQFAGMLKAKQYDDRVGRGEALVQGVSQGSTFGFADEAAAAVRAGLGNFADRTLGATLAGFGVGTPGQEDMTFGERFAEHRRRYDDDRGFGERYQSILGDQRQQVDEARRDRGGAMLAGELAGGLATGGIGAARSMAGRGLGGAMLQGAKTGAGLGALSGVGYGTGGLGGTREEGDLLTDQQKKLLAEGAGGTILGGALGGLTPAVTGVVGGVMRAVARPFTKDAKLTQEGMQQVGNALREDIQNGHITLEQARRELANTPGMTVADLGPAVRDLAESVAHTPTEAGRQLRATLTDRNANTYDRLFPALAKSLDVDDMPELAQARRELKTRMTRDADELYGQAHDQIARLSPDMVQTLRNRGFAGAMARANEVRDIYNLPRLQSGDFAPGAAVTGRDLDHVLQGMDAVVAAKFKDNPAAAVRLRDMRDKFKREVYDEAVPDLGAARAKWAGDKLMDEALDSGQKAFNMNVGEHRLLMQGMGPAEKVYHRLGVIEGISDRMLRRMTSEDVDVSKVFNEKMKRILRNAFDGDDEAANAAIDYIEQQRKMFNTFKQATGNSSTAKRLFQGSGGNLAAMLGYVTSLGTNVPLPPSLAGYFARKAYERGGVASGIARRDAVQRGGQVQGLLGNDVDALMNATRANPLNPAVLGGAGAAGALPAVQGLLQP